MFNGKQSETPHIDFKIKKFKYLFQNLAILVGWGNANKGNSETSPELKATNLAIYDYR